MPQRLRRAAVVLAIALGAAGFLTAPAGTAAGARSAAAAPSPERLLTCNRTPVVRPRSFVITCADANEQLQGITWQSWTTGAATATATFITNTCTPTCAAGTFVRYPALVELGGALQTSLGVLYTDLSWHFRSGGRDHHEHFTLLPVPERLSTCSHTSVVRPRSFVITCADANEQLQGIVWQSWNPGAATARATYVSNTCTPNCAAGRFARYPAFVELTGARFLSDDGLVFTTLRWQFTVKGVTRTMTFSLVH